MKAKHLAPLGLAGSAIGVLFVTGIHEATAAGDIGSVKTSSGHGVTQTYADQPAPQMQMGATSGESAGAAVTTSITLAAPHPGG